MDLKTSAYLLGLIIEKDAGRLLVHHFSATSDSIFGPGSSREVAILYRIRSRNVILGSLEPQRPNFDSWDIY